METLLDRRTPPGRRMGHWDETAILIAYRHGPRASELCTHVMPRDGVATARPSSATRLLSVLRESCYRHQDQQCDDHHESERKCGVDCQQRGVGKSWFHHRQHLCAYERHEK